MRFLFRLVVLALAAVGAKSLYDKYIVIPEGPDEGLALPWPALPADVAMADAG
jgi:hypothetical protein